MKTYKIYTLGCKVNQYDSSKVSRGLEQLGLIEVTTGADLAIVNTCTVTHSALTKNRKILDEARKQHPNAKFAIVGCMPVNYREEAEKLGVDYIYGAGQLDEFVDKIKNERAKSGDEGNVITPSPLVGEGWGEVGVGCNIDYKSGKSRYFLKIQDGCQQFCSYCIIPYNRGKLASRDSASILDEVRQVTGQGVAEVVLCGIHLGLYGLDRMNDKVDLVSLMKELFEIETLRKIRLSSIEITEVTDEMIELMRVDRKFARHLHISLQSGCDKILKSMNRPYTTEYFRQRVLKLRQAVPEAAISTDVIVGFPGETDEDFQMTLKYCQEIGFSKIHVFPFSAHEKTPAYAFPDQVDETLKRGRAKELQRVGDILEKNYNESFVGQEIEVIIDGRSKNKDYRAKSEYYFDVKFQSDQQFRVGQLVKVKNWELV